MSDITEYARKFLTERMTPAELDRRMDRLEEDAYELLRPMWEEWRDMGGSRSTLLVMAARLIGTAMVMGDRAVTEFEMQGGVLGDAEMLAIVAPYANAYAAAMRKAETKEGQRLN